MRLFGVCLFVGILSIATTVFADGNEKNPKPPKVTCSFQGKRVVEETDPEAQKARRQAITEFEDYGLVSADLVPGHSGVTTFSAVVRKKLVGNYEAVAIVVESWATSEPSLSLKVRFQKRDSGDKIAVIAEGSGSVSEDQKDTLVTPILTSFEFESAAINAVGESEYDSVRFPLTKAITQGLLPTNILASAEAVCRVFRDSKAQ